MFLFENRNSTNHGWRKKNSFQPNGVVYKVLAHFVQKDNNEDVEDRKTIDG